MVETKWSVAVDNADPGCPLTLCPGGPFLWRPVVPNSHVYLRYIWLVQKGHAEGYGRWCTVAALDRVAFRVGKHVVNATRSFYIVSRCGRITIDAKRDTSCHVSLAVDTY